MNQNEHQKVPSDQKLDEVQARNELKKHRNWKQTLQHERKTNVFPNPCPLKY